MKKYVRHGLTYHPAFKSWSMMMARCYNPNYNQFGDYGDRGIDVCERWQSVENFIADMFYTWFQGATLERRDVNKGYTADNCLWVTKTDQNLNTRRTVWVDWADGSREPVSVVARRTGVCDETAYNRLKKGLPPQVAFCPSKLVRVFSVLTVLLMLPSCLTITNANGNIAWGGKGAARGNGWAVVFDNEKSFQDGAILATAAAGAWASVASDKAAELTARSVNSNATKQAINASNNATAVELGAQKAGVETTKILSTPK